MKFEPCFWSVVGINTGGDQVAGERSTCSLKLPRTTTSAVPCRLLGVGGGREKDLHVFCQVFVCTTITPILYLQKSVCSKHQRQKEKGIASWGEADGDRAW